MSVTGTADRSPAQALGNVGVRNGRGTKHAVVGDPNSWVGLLVCLFCCGLVHVVTCYMLSVACNGHRTGQFFPGGTVLPFRAGRCHGLRCWFQLPRDLAIQVRRASGVYLAH